MRRNYKNKIIKLAVCFAVIIGSPFLAAAAIKSAPAMSLLAGKAANLAAGATLGQVPEKVSETTVPVEPPTTTAIPDFDDTMMRSFGFPSELIPSSENEEVVVQDFPQDKGPKPYPEKIETRSGAITTLKYEKANGTQFFSLDGGGQVRNTTSVPTEKLIAEGKLLPQFKVDFNSAPQVLIMHTHTTESFEPYARDFYDASFNSRTTDESKNMVSVGNKIEAELSAAGIGVIHDKTIHDYPSYNGSYDRSAVTVKAILAQNPSIKIVLDIHRDAIEKKGGERVAPVANIGGKNAAQIMIISGCDDGTLNMPKYMENFRFSALLQQQLESDYAGITRPVFFAYRKYNQDLTTGSILIEVGGHANSLEQAQYSGELIGKSLSKALLKIKN
ncbi:MAG: stage II sporulation protein P [Oscillospiraceae bacterium]